MEANTTKILCDNFTLKNKLVNRKRSKKIKSTLSWYRLLINVNDGPKFHGHSLYFKYHKGL
ncbi:hypothetical protein GCM10007863_46040 [Dyella mobilis]|nr:hypothetical protein GCM10007863_46040 [Dyella mobilis]